MRIGINALSATIGGGVTFLQNLVPALAEQDGENEYYLFATAENYDHIFGGIRFNDRVRVIKLKTPNLFIRLLKEQFLLPRLVKKYRIDILMCSANINSFLAPCKKILWVLNIYPYFNLNLPGESWFERLRFKALRMLTSLSIRLSSRAIFISNFSRQSILSMVPVDPHKTLTIYLGADTQAFSSSGKGSDNGDRYILSVSSISKRKNYEVLMRAYDQLGADFRGKYRVILIGEVTPELKDYLRSYLRAGSRERIVFKGKVDFAELCRAYREASLFVLPSLVEAFGLPVIEAMASGLPVLVADATSLPEIVGEAGLKFDPSDPADLARKIEQVSSDENMSAGMIARGRARARDFTWENTARETIKCFAELKI
jgi:glycosyltransferase involved in cell wall biosynthesis